MVGFFTRDANTCVRIFNVRMNVLSVNVYCQLDVVYGNLHQQKFPAVQYSNTCMYVIIRFSLQCKFTINDVIIMLLW